MNSFVLTTESLMGSWAERELPALLFFIPPPLYTAYKLNINVINFEYNLVVFDAIINEIHVFIHLGQQLCK